MNTSRVEIRIYLDEFREPLELCIPLDRSFVFDIAQPLEFADDAMSLMFRGHYKLHEECIKTRRKALELRRGFAGSVTDQIQQMLIDKLGEKDTVRGYTKTQDEEYKTEPKT